MTNYHDLPQLPQNVEAEEAVLGSCIIDPEAIFRVAPILTPSKFYIQKNGWIYSALRAIRGRDDPIDLVTLCDELERREQLEEIGGASYITRLINAVPSAFHAESYAEIVDMAAERRDVLRSLSSISKICYDETIDRDTFQERARAGIDGALSDGVRAEAVTASEAIPRLIERAAEWANNPLKPGEVRGLSTGILSLDNMLRGLKTGFYLVGAVQHTGKTAFMQQIFANLGKQGVPTLFFSMEHSADYMFTRIGSALSGISIVDIEAGLDFDRLREYTEALARVHTWPIEFIEGSRTLPQIANEVRARDVEAVFVDNLEITAGSAPGAQDYIQYRNAAYGLLGIAQDNGVPIFGTMQAGTKMASQRPNHEIELSDLYGSDGPSMAATVTLLLHRSDRWTFEKDPTRMTQYEADNQNIMHVACWKDKANHCASGKGCRLQFWHQGQVRDRDHRDTPEVQF
jgi:replicative DNA helicase